MEEILVQEWEKEMGIYFVYGWLITFQQEHFLDCWDEDEEEYSNEGGFNSSSEI